MTNVINSPEEIWKDIKGFEGKYQISNLGRVKSLDRLTPVNGQRYRPYKMTIKGKILKNFTSTPGYYICSLVKGGVGASHFIHRLIAEAFVENPEAKPHVNHINGIKTDNRIENLEWCTHLENMRHARNTGLTSQEGENGARAIITNMQARAIRDLYATGRYKQYQIGEIFNIGYRMVSEVVNYKTYKTA